MEALMGLENTAEVKSAMGGMFNDSKIIWQTLIPRSGESTVTVRLKTRMVISYLARLLPFRCNRISPASSLVDWTDIDVTGAAAVLWL